MTTVKRPTGASRAAVRAAVDRLEEAAAGLSAVTSGQPASASLEEEVCDRLIDLAAARAWLRTPEATAPQDADEVLHGCVHWAVEEDVTRVLVQVAPGQAGPMWRGRTVHDAHRQVTALITALADPARYDAVCARLRQALGYRPEGRAVEAWDSADEALRGLVTVRDDWAGADPARTAAGGWVLVDRIARLDLLAALLADMAAQPSRVRRHGVNAARRHAWNRLRLPPPEAASETHLRRTAELVEWIGWSSRATLGPDA